LNVEDDIILDNVPLKETDGNTCTTVVDITDDVSLKANAEDVTKAV